jgi:hypothetical protein
MLAGSIATSKLANQNIGFRNLIINGDMSIAQRGTSVNGITSSSYYTVDRFKCDPTNMGTWTMSQSTDTPTGQGFATSLKMDCTTADASPATSDKLLIQQRIEGQNLQYLKKGTSSAESLTCSFWVKSNKTGTYILNLYESDNTRDISKSYTINSANTWEKKTLTFAGDTTGTITNDNNLSLVVGFYLGAGTDFTSGTLNTSWNTPVNANTAVGQVNLADNTSNEWYITGVQLEAGTTASDFEFLPYDVNLKRCQRYYQILSPTNPQPIVQYQANFRSYVQTFMTQMRTAPSLTVDTFSSFAGFGGNLTTTTGVHAYYGVSYTNADSMQIQGMRLNAEL